MAFQPNEMVLMWLLQLQFPHYSIIVISCLRALLQNWRKSAIYSTYLCYWKVPNKKQRLHCAWIIIHCAQFGWELRQIFKESHRFIVFCGHSLSALRSSELRSSEIRSGQLRNCAKRTTLYQLRSSLFQSYFAHKQYYYILHNEDS